MPEFCTTEPFSKLLLFTLSERASKIGTNNLVLNKKEQGGIIINATVMRAIHKCNWFYVYGKAKILLNSICLSFV